MEMENYVNTAFEILEKTGKFEQAERTDSRESKETSEVGRSLVECRLMIEDSDFEKASEIIEDLERQLGQKRWLESQNFIKIYIEICRCLIENQKNHTETAHGILTDLLTFPLSQEYLPKIRFFLSRAFKKSFYSTKDLEKQSFLEIFNKSFNVTPSSSWHIISSEWFSSWCSYVGASPKDFSVKVPPLSWKSSKRPGPIESSSILCSQKEEDFLKDPLHPYYSLTLKPGLSEGIDYLIISDSAFDVLANSYGVKQDITRHAIEQNDTIYQIEIYLKTIQVAYLSNNKLIIKQLSTSRKNTISYVKKLALNQQNIQSRVWKIDLNKLPLDRLKILATKTFQTYLSGSAVLEDQVIIDDAEISESNLLLVEVNYQKKYIYSDDPSLLVNKCYFCQSSSQSVKCKQCKRKLYCSADCLNKNAEEHNLSCRIRPNKGLFNFFSCFCRQNDGSDSEEEQSQSLPAYRKDPKLQLVGLQNLGNTCFMNSALQCLAAISDLSSFFLSNSFRSQINKSNPLGTHGKLAFEYADFLNSMQKSKEKSVAPWKLKKTISMYATQFYGHQQHDAHEFLMFLVNGLHEDLNQITKKPYYQNDVGETELVEMGNEYWKRHLSRNKSFIVDLMHGQYKSTLECPKCRHVSHMFDPFNCLSLPIPQVISKKITVKYVPDTQKNAPVQLFNFLVDSQATVQDVIDRVSMILRPRPSLILPMEIGPKVCEEVHFSEPVSSIKLNSLYFYECVEEFNKYVLVKFRSESCYSFECYPRLVRLAEDSTFEDLHREVFKSFATVCLGQKDSRDYSELLQEGFYKIYYEANQDNACIVCSSKRCRGCCLGDDKWKVQGYYKEKTFFCVYFNLEKNKKSQIVDLNLLRQSVTHKPQDLTKKKNLSIYDCFESFREPEILDNSNEWYCPKCKKHVQALKKMEVFRLPPVLIIHLKRFKIFGFTREKLNIPVQFPVENLDLKKYVSGHEPSGPYELFAVSNHFGALAGGHYTASVKHNSRWYYCNDSEISENRELSDFSSSYVLFYKLKI